MANISPLGNELAMITPSSRELRHLFYQQVHFFEKLLLSKMFDNNNLRISNDSPLEKCIKMDVFQLVFSLSLKSRFNTSEIQSQEPQFIANLTTLGRVIEVFGAKSLVRRFRSGDFTVILPMHAVLSDIAISEGKTINSGQLVIVLEKHHDKWKCLIPFGGADPENDLNSFDYVNTYIETSQGKLWFPNFRGEGTLSVEKGYCFVYGPCGSVDTADILVIRGIEYYVKGVSNDTFNPQRDIIRLNHNMNFNSKHCVYEIRKPVQIQADTVDLPDKELKCIKNVTLDYIFKEDKNFNCGKLELKFWNAAFNKMGILTHDIAIPSSELA